MIYTIIAFLFGVLLAYIIDELFFKKRSPSIEIEGPALMSALSSARDSKRNEKAKNFIGSGSHSGDRSISHSLEEHRGRGDGKNVLRLRSRK